MSEYRHSLSYLPKNYFHLIVTSQFASGGVATYLFWRSAYLSTLFSLRNRTLVATDWLKVKLFGRYVQIKRFSLFFAMLTTISFFLSTFSEMSVESEGRLIIFIWNPNRFTLANTPKTPGVKNP